jgi:hypothetical protein
VGGFPIEYLIMKWIDEKVLQRYFKEEFNKYNDWFISEYDKKLVSVSFNSNFDKYPDLYGTLEGNQIIPIEVEWITSNFESHKHDPTLLTDGNGLIVVLQNNLKDYASLKQLELDENHFQQWFVNNSSKIIKESIDKAIDKREKIKRPPKLWFYYLSESALKNHITTREEATYGVPYIFPKLNDFKDIRKGDLFSFIGPFTGYKKGGRENQDLFVKNRNLQCRTVELFRVKTDYYYDETKIWEFNPPRLDPKKNVKNYPHRFKFEKEIILDLENINIYKLTLPSKRLLHKLPYVALSDGKSDILVDLISKSKKN